MNILKIRGNKKKILIIIFDLLVFNFSYWLSYNIRDEIFIFPNSNQLIHLSIGNLLFIILYLNFDINNFVTRYFDFEYVKQFIKFLSFFLVIFFGITLILKINTVPRSSPLITTIVFFSLVIVSRYLVLNLINLNFDKQKDKLIIIGDSDEIYNYHNFSLEKNKIQIIGFFTKNKNMIGRKVSNITIYSLSKINIFLKHNKIDRAIIASDQFSVNKLRKLIKILNFFKIKTFYYNFNKINLSIDQISDINNKLSTRDIEFFYKKNFEEFKNSSILISGAGGSIGSELSKQLIKFKPKKIILLELSEINLFNINNEIENLNINGDVSIVSILGDINDFSFIKNIFNHYRPNFVYHAAAIKHVAISENNPMQCVKTNVIGSNNIMYLSNRFHVKKFILISTDKAVNPVNIMGKTKRIAEILLQYHQNKSVRTVFNAVRFGNVANSSGSLFPIWRNQLLRNKKLTITDPSATRFLMSITEAASLVLDASILGKKGKIFVLDMGKPIKIIDLAKSFLESYGLKLRIPNKNKGQIDYKIIGLRPGEKKHEELFYGKDYTRTLNPYIFDSNELFKSQNTDIKIFINKLDKLINKNKILETKKLIENILKK